MTQTARDRAWLVVIDALRTHTPLQTEDVTDDADVSSQTARAVLRVAEDVGLLRRSSEQGRTWYPDIGILGEVDDAEYRRLFTDLLNEAKND